MSFTPNDSTRLGDLGEFRILGEVVLPALRNVGPPVPLGDDCASVPLPVGARQLVITTDVAPCPLAWRVGLESYRSWGWYAVLINASDLAAAGARPLAFTSSVEAPASFEVEALRLFFDGVAAACAEFGFANAGGNLRAAPRFACHATVMGTSDSPVGRRGAKPGDVLYSVGDLGRFAAAYLAGRHAGPEGLASEEREVLLYPRPRQREMQSLLAAGYVTAASDNSDGVLGAVWNIAEASGVGIDLDFDGLGVECPVREAAAAEGLDPLNLQLFWGDWQVVVTIPPRAVREAERVATMEGFSLIRLGRCLKGPPRLVGTRAGRRGPVRLLRNENFSPASFNADLDAHIDHMLRAPIFLIPNEANIT